jgi:hypothetical protein
VEEKKNVVATNLHLDCENCMRHAKNNDMFKRVNDIPNVEWIGMFTCPSYVMESSKEDIA